MTQNQAECKARLSWWRELAPAEGVELFPDASLADLGREPEAVSPRATQVQRVLSKVASQRFHMEMPVLPCGGVSRMKTMLELMDCGTS